jgi:hypothetical protein
MEFNSGFKGLMKFSVGNIYENLLRKSRCSSNMTVMPGTLRFIVAGDMKTP